MKREAVAYHLLLSLSTPTDRCTPAPLAVASFCTSYMHNLSKVMNDSPDFSSCSVEKLLAVPLEFIFRETRTAQNAAVNPTSRSSLSHSPHHQNKSPSNNQRNFLFSRSEISSLVRVSLLSSELDVLLGLVYKALDRSQKCQAYRQIIQTTHGNNSNETVHFRALLPLIHVHAELTSEVVLNHASESFGISRILNELDACAMELGKFAEQNWNMAEQFDWAMMPGQSNILSSEKRAIAEIEEIIAERIQNLKGMTMGLETSDALGGVGKMNEKTKSDAFDQACNEDTSFCYMESVCQRVFNQPSLFSSAEGSMPMNVASLEGDALNEENFNESQVSVTVQNAAEALHVLGSLNRGLN